ncbi:hypothetical protein VH567_13430 [Sphingomonas sp. 4RDLI-65]
MHRLKDRGRVECGLRGPLPVRRWQWLWIPVTIAGLLAFGWLSFR